MPAGAKATITTFDVPGEPETFGMGINSGGSVAGEYVDSNRQQHGFVRTPDGTITTFDVEGASDTVPESINRSGEIAGYYLAQGGGGSFFRDAQGNITTFQPGFIGAVIINDRGQIAGNESDGTGFVRNTDGTITTVDVGHDTNVGTMNDRGIVAGSYYKQKLEYGFVRRPGGRVVSFRPTILTEVHGINHAGAIVGQVAHGKEKVHGFIRTLDGTITTFDPPGSTFTKPTGIDNDGRITGAYSSDAFHGFLRHRDGTISTFDPAGSDETIPEGINHSGIITGWYDDSAGIHGFIRTP